MGRTRWDALAEELADPQPEREASVLETPERGVPEPFAPARFRKTTVFVAVDGLALSGVTDVEIASYGAGEHLEGVRGRFKIPWLAIAAYNIVGKELLMLVLVDGEAEMRYALRVTQTQTYMRDPETAVTTVDFRGVRV